MLIDFTTGKLIEENKTIKLLQHLTKTVNLIDSNNINSNTDNWERVFQNNGVLSPYIILECCKNIIRNVIENKPIDKEYCKCIHDQCLDWEVSDQFAVIENETSKSKM